MTVYVRAVLAAPLLLLAGCHLPSSARIALTPPFQPANVYRREPRLPPYLRRVAVLPVTHVGQDHDRAFGAAMLTPILVAELRKQDAFEIVTVTPEQLQALSGQSAWKVDERLPSDFFQRLQTKFDCDAVLFSRLTVFRPYPPLAVGWDLHLVGCRRGLIWWAFDEVFDAGSASVANAAEAYGRRDLNLPAGNGLDPAILNSPSRFGQYTAHAVVATLPAR